MLGIALCLIAFAANTPESGIRFVDSTKKAGIHFVHHTGATGKKYLPETLGAGCAFIDLDGDGWPDILLINGKDFVPHGQKSLPALYRNNRNGTFTDITRGFSHSYILLDNRKVIIYSTIFFFNKMSAQIK